MVFTKEEPDGRPRWQHLDLAKLGIFLSGTACDEIQRRGLEKQLLYSARECWCFESRDPLRSRDALKWGLFSATAGLYLARQLGARTVNVYGADWTDEPDFDGVAMEGNRRNQERWGEERRIWHDLIEHLGLTVHRI